MKKKILALAACAQLFAIFSFADAQQPGKVFRIGFLDGSTASGLAGLLDAFRQELNRLGWIDGKNITIEYRFGEQKNERLPELAAELVRLKVDLFMVTGGPPALAAKNATTTIPIVFINIADPVELGFVKSLARPGGNVTGLSDFGKQLITKRLEILKDAFPNLLRVGVLWRPGTITQDRQLKELRLAAVPLKVKLEEIDTDPKSLDSAFQTAKQKQIKAIMTTSTPRLFVERKRIV